MMVDRNTFISVDENSLILVLGIPGILLAIEGLCSEYVTCKGRLLKGLIGLERSN